jgi:hypothetical protein
VDAVGKERHTMTGTEKITASGADAAPDDAAPSAPPWTRAEVDGEILLTCTACGYVHRYAAGDEEMVAKDVTYCVGCGRP